MKGKNVCLADQCRTEELERIFDLNALKENKVIV